NTLMIEQVGKMPDDIRVGEITLDDRPVAKVLSETVVEVTVREELGPNRTSFVPCRVTVVDERGALMTVGASSDGHLAVRPGVIYTSDGKARFTLPAGEYTVFGGRGFAYSVASARLT